LEKLIGSLTIGNEELTVIHCRYKNGREAVELVDADGEVYAHVSCNIVAAPPPSPGCFYAKTWSENEPLRAPLLASGLFEDLGVRVQTGFAEAELWKIHAEG